MFCPRFESLANAYCRAAPTRGKDVLKKSPLICGILRDQDSGMSGSYSLKKIAGLTAGESNFLLLLHGVLLSETLC